MSCEDLEAMRADLAARKRLADYQAARAQERDGRFLPRAWLKTDAGAAAVAQAWYEGLATQKHLAAIFGYKGSGLVCVAILHFLLKYSDRPANDLRTNPYLQGDGRRALVPQAIEAYRRSLT